MATSVSWSTAGFGVIFVPRADMTLVQPSPEVRSINVNTLRGDVGALFASVEGGPYVKPFIHNGEITIAGVTYARSVQFLYAVEFEDAQYEVRPFGANHNLLDVHVVNQVSISSNNSAGLISVATLAADAAVARKAATNRLEVDFTAQDLILYDDDGTTPIRRWPLETDVGPAEPVTTAAGVQTKRKASTI